MNEPLLFDNSDDFLRALRQLKEEGKTWRELRLHMPFNVPEVEEILEVPAGGMRFFAVAGALAGFLGGFALTIYTVLDWPIIVGGKPIVSVPPFLLIAYILTILFGSLAVFGGFLLLARMPSVREIRECRDFGNHFAILPGEEEGPWKQ